MEPEPAESTPLDLDAIGRDLERVEATLAELDSGEYWASQADPATVE